MSLLPIHKIGAANFSGAASTDPRAYGGFSNGGCGTRRRGSLAAMTEYALRITDHGNVFITFELVGFRYQKFCQRENLNRKLARIGRNKSKDDVSQ